MRSGVAGRYTPRFRTARRLMSYLRIEEPELDAEREVGREGVVNDGVDDHGTRR